MNKKMWFLTKKSLNKKTKTKWFLIANIIFLILIIGIANIDIIIKAFGGNFNEQTEILIIDNAHIFEEFKTNYEKASKYINQSESVSITRYDKDYDTGIKYIEKEHNKIILEIDYDNINYLKAKVASKESLSTITNAIINSALKAIRSEIVLKKYNITKEEFNNIDAPVELEVTILNEDDKYDDVIVSSIMQVLTIPIFMLIMFLVQMIGAEVNEEKSTKSMEIIISNVSPRAHFLSKVIAANLFVLIQSSLLIGYAIVAVIIRFILTGGNLIGNIDSDIINAASNLPLDTITNTIGVILPIFIIMMVLTFIAYSLLAGILASMTTNLEDFQQLQTPIVIVSIAGYYLSIMAGIFKGSIFIKIMSFIPFISSLLTPTLYVMGEVGLGDLIISILLLSGVIYILIKYGLRIYKVGILNYSGTGLWKKMAKAIKEK